MKTIIKLALATLLALMPAAGFSKRPFVGVWEMTLLNGKPLPANRKMLKKVSPEGWFVVLRSVNGGKSYSQIQSGSWKAAADNVYIEYDLQTDPKMQVPIKCEFDKRGAMSICYENDTVIAETWVPYNPRKK